MKLWFWACFFCCLVRPFIGYAAPLPVPSSSGGIVDREIEAEYEAEPVTPDKEIPQLDVDLPQEQLSAIPKEKVEIKKIELQGNQLLSTHQLSKVYQKYEGNKLSMAEIVQLCKEIQKIYISEGYFLVRVFPPAQTVKKGILTIEVLEVKIGKIFIEGNKHYSTKFINKYFHKFQDKCIRYDDLMKQLLLLNEFSDLKTGVAFQRGTVPGTTDMIVQIQDAPPYHLYADYNNYGSSVTSQQRMGARTDLGNTIVDGDKLTLVGVMGFPPRQLQFGDVIYQAPLNASGTGLEVACLGSHFHVDRLNPLHLKGNTVVATVKLNQAMQRTRSYSSNLFLTFDYMDIRNYQLGDLSSNDNLRVLTGGWKCDYLDPIGGRNLAAFEASFGIPGFLGGLSAVDPASSRQGTGGRFIFASGSYQRLQKMPHDWLLYLNFQGQYSFYKLPVSEEFYIGGITTVRGYPMATALGDSGFCVNLEARFPPPFFHSKMIPKTTKSWGEVLQLLGFIDQGAVYVKDGGIVGQTNQVYLTGIGLGARIFALWDIDLSFDWGFPLTNQMRPSNSVFYFKINKRFL
ncbi:MAG: ShlB/FhaC/HecB family hemolysin secretion/activation protein [Chlamydiales bacterium]|nr:ShlB/FhaC/HecB family hemolysin secretion/activation protein [Chlamydiales bacterium]